MQAIASRILDSVLGKYVEGIDSQNIKLSIWNGDFSIENVSLKKDALEDANLPVNLVHSHIGRVWASLPWKNISSKPVEMELDDIYVVVSPKSKEDLMKIALDLSMNRKAFIDNYAKQIEETIKKQSKEVTDDGYTARVTKKIIDNIQVRVRNIHIRLESHLEGMKPFAVGASIDSLNIFTTDENGKKIFLDRTKKENKDKPMYKQLNLGNLSVYWNHAWNGESYVMGGLTATNQQMRDTIYSKANDSAGHVNDFNYMLQISADIKLIQYIKTQLLIDQKKPEIELLMELEKINSFMHKDQFQQVMVLLDYFSDYLQKAGKEQDKLKYKYLRPLKHFRYQKLQQRSSQIKEWWQFAKKGVTMERQNQVWFVNVFGIGKEQLQKYRTQFLVLYKKRIALKAKETLSKPEEDVFNTIIMSVSEEEVKKWVAEVVKEKLKNAKLESKKGYFSGFFSSSTEQVLTPEEEAQLEKELNEAAQGISNKDLEIPADYQWLNLKYRQKKGALGLKRDNQDKKEESVAMQIHNLDANFSLRQGGMDLEVYLDDFNIEFLLKNSKSNVVRSPIFKPISKDNNHEMSNKLLALGFSQNPLDRPGLDHGVTLKITHSEIVYNARSIACLLDIFDTSNAKVEALKQAATETAEEVNKQSQEKLTDLMKNQKTLMVDIEISAPMIVLPFDQSEVLTSECWILRPGILNVIGDNFTNRDNEEPDQMYDKYTVKLTEIRVEYFPSLLHYKEEYDYVGLESNQMAKNMFNNKEQLVKQGTISNFGRFKLLKDFTISVDLGLLKNKFQAIGVNKPRTTVQCSISTLQVDLKEKIYDNLLRMGDIFKDSGSLDILQTDKKGLLSSNTIFGYIQRGNALMYFGQVFGIVSGGKLYFFKKNTEKAAYDFYNLRGLKTRVMSEIETGQPHALKIKNYSGKHMFLAFESKEKLIKWRQKLMLESKKYTKKAIKQLPSSSPEAATATDNAKTQIKKGGTGFKKSYVDFLLEVKLKAELMQLRVFEKDKHKFDFRISELGLNVEQREFCTDLDVTLKSIQINNVQEKDENLRNLISSEIGTSIATKVPGLGITADQTNDTLVQVKVTQMNKNSSEYDHIDTKVDIKLGTLFVNLRPRNIHSLMVFFVPEPKIKGGDDSSMQSGVGSRRGSGLSAIGDQKEPSQNQEVVSQTTAVEVDNNNYIDIEKDKNVQLHVTFSLERISVILVNDVADIYQAHASLSRVEITFISKLSKIHLKGKLSNLQLHDLTNYPKTLTTKDFESIVPTELFGMKQKKKTSSGSLIDLELEQLNNLIVQPYKDLSNGNLRVNISQIRINLYMQVIMRIIDFANTQLIPALDAKKKFETLNVANGAPDKKVQVVKQSREVLIQQLKRPYWMKINVEMASPIIDIKVSPDAKSYLVASLGAISVSNFRIQSMERVFEKRSADEITKKLGLGEKFEGIWVENFSIKMKNLSIREKHILPDGSKASNYIMHDYNFYLGLVMPQFKEPYKELYGALDDPKKSHHAYTMQEKKPLGDKLPKQCGLTYDGGMLVKARITPIIMIFGNHEFNFIMRTLFWNITYNDGNDKFFQRQYDQIQRDLKLNPQAPNMQVQIDIERIAMITMDDAPQSGEKGLELTKVLENKVYEETRKTYAKLYLENMRIGVLMHSNKDMEVRVSMKDLKASYFQKKDPSAAQDVLDFYEKGFIGTLSITESYSEPSCQKLKEAILAKLSQESQFKQELETSEVGKTVHLENTNFSFDNLSLDTNILMRSNGTMDVNVELRKLKILAQTNVLLKLSQISQMNPDVKPPEEEKPIEENIRNSRSSSEILKNIRTDVLAAASQKSGVDGAKMVVNVNLRRVMFVIPTQDHKETLVTSGDLQLKVLMYDSMPIERLEQKQQALLRKKAGIEEVAAINKTMELDVKLNEFQIFICQFRDVLTKKWMDVDKRHLLLPLNLSLKMTDYQPVLNGEYLSNKILEPQGEAVIFKIALSDIDILNLISAHQLKMLDEGTPKESKEKQEKLKEDKKKKAEAKKLEEQSIDPIEKQAKESLKKNLDEIKEEVEVEDEEAQPEKVLDILKKEDSTQKDDDNKQLTNILQVKNLKLETIQIFVINDEERIFVPVLDFTMSNITASIKVMEQTIINTNLAISINYYNPQVSEWEPFIENSGFEIHVLQTINPETKGQVLQVEMDLLEPEFEVFNINLSMKGLQVVLSTLETFNKWNEKRIADTDKVKSKKMVFLKHIENLEDYEDPVEAEETDFLQKESTVNHEEADGEDEEIDNNINYVSPYLLVNFTGYELAAEEYIRTNRMIDSSGKIVDEKEEDPQDIVEDISQAKAGLNPSRNALTSKMVRKHLGRVYKVPRNDSINLNFDNDVKLKTSNSKLKLEKEGVKKKLTIRVKHDITTVNEIYGITLDTQYSKRLKLSGGRPSISEFSLIVESRFDNNKKLLTISSSALIKNMTEIPLKVNIKHPNKEVNLDLKTGVTLPVPFDYVTSKFTVSLDGSSEESQNYYLTKLTNKEDGYVKELRLSDGRYVLAKVSRDMRVFQRVTIVLLPVFRAVNCFPVELQLQLNSGEERETCKLLPQKSYSFYNIKAADGISVKARVSGYAFSDSHSIVSKGIKTTSLDEIEVKDSTGNEGMIKLDRSSDHDNHFTYAFYAPAVLINETPLDLVASVVQKNKKEKPVGGTLPIHEEELNKKIMLLRSVEDVLKLNLSQNFLQEHFPGLKNVNVKNTLPVKALDTTVYPLQISKDGKSDNARLLELGVRFISLSVNKSRDIYSKVLQISPRNIIINCLELPLQIRQKGETELLSTVNPGERLPFWWTSTSSPQQIRFKVQNHELDLDWSAPVDINNLGTVPIMMQNSQKGTTMPYKYEIKMAQGVQYIFFKEIPEDRPNIIIKNDTKGIHAVAYQMNCKDKLQSKIEPQNEMKFGWIEPDKEKTLEINLSQDGQNWKFMKVQLAEINNNTRVALKDASGKTKYVNVSVILQKTTKVVKIRDVINLQIEKALEHQISQLNTKNETQVALKFKGLGISLIAPVGEERLEPLYIYFENLTFVYSQNDLMTSYQLQIQYINIDNNCLFETPFPVLLTPTHFKEVKSSSSDNHMINIVLRSHNASNLEMQLYDFVGIDVKALTLTLDDFQQQVLTKVGETIQKQFEEKMKPYYLQKYFYVHQLTRKEQDEEEASPSLPLYEYEEDRKQWQMMEPPNSKNYIYIREMKISPLQVKVSFKTRPKETMPSVYGLGTNVLLGSLGIAFLNLDEAPLKIAGFKSTYIFNSVEGLTDIIQHHYVINGAKQALKLVGSLDIIGNPVNLFSNVGTGITDFFDKPIKGFVKGPIEGAKGLGEGTGSLVKNTVAATFTSVSAISGSVASGLSALTMDEEYIRQRERMQMKRPKNVISGIGTGAQSLATGVFKGITGKSSANPRCYYSTSARGIVRRLHGTLLRNGEGGSRTGGKAHCWST